MLGGPPRQSPRSHPVHPGQGWPAALSRLRPGPQGCPGPETWPGLPPHASVPIHPRAELDSSGVTRRSPAPGGRGDLPRSPGAPSARPTAAGELSERGAMLVSHRLTCGPRRVSSSSATSALSQRASSRPTPRARGQRTPRLPLLLRRSMTRRSARPLLLQAPPPPTPRSAEQSIAPPGLGPAPPRPLPSPELFC